MTGERVRMREGIDGLHLQQGSRLPIAWEAKTRSTTIRHWWPWSLRGVSGDADRRRDRRSRVGRLVPWLLLALVSWVVPGFFSLLVILLTLVAVALVLFVLLVHFPLRWLSGQLQRPRVAQESRNGFTPPSAS